MYARTALEHSRGGNRPRVLWSCPKFSLLKLKYARDQIAWKRDHALVVAHDRVVECLASEGHAVFRGDQLLLKRKKLNAGF